MIWQNPWAWLGLGTIAIPVLIHFLGRDRAPRYSFPSLRFIEIAELPPTRRTRLHDLLLLATRVALLAVAVAALAQPLLLLRSRRAAIDDRLARAVVVDTSASMFRSTPTGNRAIDSARSAARTLASGARPGIIIETTSPRSVIDGAIGWLESQPSRRELVIVSDFQVGAVDSVAIAAVPGAIGIRAVAIPAKPTDPRFEQASIARAASIVARIDVASAATNVSWLLGSPTGATVEPRIEIDAGDRPTVDAVASVARIVGVAEPIDSTSQVTVVFGNAPDRDELARRATRVTSPKLIDLVARVRADFLLASTQNQTDGRADTVLSHFGPAMISDVSGRATAVAAEDTASGTHRLLVFSNDSLISVRSVALIAAIRRALSVAPSIGELDPSTISPSVIASWQRGPGASPTRETVDSGNGSSDGRWLWALVLALIGVESWLRRDREASAIRFEERAHDRAA